MKKVHFGLCILVLLTGGNLLFSADAPAPLTLVDSFDAGRYLGRWYEIARYQHSFEKTLVGATAEYSLRTDGKIEVVNSGFKRTLDGPLSSVKAVAWIPDNTKPAALKVKFFNLFTADYLVFGLDDVHYEWALVGNNSRSYLWFLARTPTISEELYAQMKKLAQNQGYDLTNLYEVPQKAR